MQLVQTVAIMFRGIGARMRRDAMAYTICAVCGVSALILATWASVVALLHVAGPVYAQLIVAGGYILIALATILWLQRAKSHAPPIIPLTLGNEPRQQLQFAQIAMIVEAVLLGYYLSRRSNRR
jgi:hypothetical protein